MFEMELGWDRPAHSGPRPSPHVLRVRIRPQAGHVPAQGLPLRLAIAVDTSSSMDGPMLAHARASCLAVLAQLRPEDRFSLAGFASDVTPLLEGLPGGPEACDVGASAIAGLEAFGVTRTDLALEWLLRALPPEPGTMRMGVLVTDGHPTDLQGQPLPTTTELLDRAGRLDTAGATLCTVGLGDAGNFNSSFLVDLSDRGRGAFLYADTPEALQPQLRARLAAGQSVTATDLRLMLRPLLPGVVLKGCCRLRPEFVPLELPVNPNEAGIRLGGIQGDAPTDVLVSIEAPPAGFGDLAGARPIVALRLEGEQAAPREELQAYLHYTDSYVEAQRIDSEINKDRLHWELNVYSQALNRSANIKQTAALLGDIAHTAHKAGQESLAIQATGQLADLQKGGRLDAHRATGILVQTRRPGGTG
jgi:Ca-activated chloride channel family protein